MSLPSECTYQEIALAFPACRKRKPRNRAAYNRALLANKPDGAIGVMKHESRHTTDEKSADGGLSGIADYDEVRFVFLREIYDASTHMHFF